MKILIINQNWFKKEWQEDGDEVYSVGMTDDFDLKISYVMDIKEILGKLPNNFSPDRIVVFDNSAPLYIKGLESIDIPTLFYSVDIHQHYILHKLYCDVFDDVFVAMKDYIPILREEGCTRVEWLPLWASMYVPESKEKRYDAVFVGTLNKTLNPDRVKFFDELKKKTNILCMQGRWWEIFPYSNIVVNQTVKGDLNFRVFEAMGTGSLLLTEKTGNGLFDLFEDKKHLITYSKGNVDEATELIEYYLSHSNEAALIAHCGREEILKKHTSRVRADKIKKKIISCVINRNYERASLSMAYNFLEIFVSTKKNSIEFARAMLALSMDYLLKIDFDNINLSREDCWVILLCAINHDRIFHTDTVTRMISYLSKKCDYNGFKYYDLWSLLNKGKYDVISKTYPGLADAHIFNLINQFVTSFII